MAITANQRTLALEAITQAALAAAPPIVPSGTPNTTLLPGSTPAGIWAFIVAAIGTTADANLTIICNNLVALYNSQLTPEQAVVTATQAQITAATVV